MAEGEGFEPPVRFPVQWFSRPPPSTTRPSLPPSQAYITKRASARLTKALKARGRVENQARIREVLAELGPDPAV